MNEEELLVNRIKECGTVIRDIENSPAWKVVIQDMDRQREYLDSNWQDITDKDKLQLARELKHSVLHVLNIKEKYQADLKASQERLDVITNPTEVIDKDYDTEGIK